MDRRTERTDLTIISDGDFAKIGRHHFIHESGAEIKYLCNHYCWQILGGKAYQTLREAVYQVRKRHHQPKEIQQ